MVGGRVIEVCEFKDKIFVDTRDKNNTCGVFMEKNSNSLQIQIGDSVWWQCGYCYWTPQDSLRDQQSINFDIPILKIGYSGSNLIVRKI